RVANPRAADETEAALGADPIRGHVVDMVLERAAVGDEARGRLGARWPVGREGDEVGSLEGEHPGRLGEGPVVADVHPDPERPRLVDGEWLVAGLRETVKAEEREVNLPVLRCHSVRSYQRTGIEEPGPVCLDEAHDREGLQLATRRGKATRARPRDWLREGASLVGGLEAVPGEGALGEDGEERPLARRLLERFEDPR